MAHLLPRTPRRPESTALYQLVARHLEPFLARIQSDDRHGPLPRFVSRELRAFLDCGRLARGFCRVHCDACGKDDLVAFACKRRGFCPSCGARRMADTAAWLVDRVIPDVPVRQWVLSLPHRIRHLCAFDHHAAREVRGVVIRVISAFYRRQTKQITARGKTGAIAFTQRFDSALRLNLHFHTLWPDGVFDCASSRDDATFHEAPQPTQADIERLAHTIETRVLRRLRRCGRLTDLDGADSTAHAEDDPSLFDTMRAAAILGVSALGSRQGRGDPRLRQDAPGADFDRGKLCANSNGFSLHGGVRVDACNKKRLEKLIRYAARPPIVPQRLTITENGKALYAFKRPWRDGSTHVVLEPETLLERLTALIPHPFVKLVNYHGVFASAFPLRHTVVPPPPDDARAHPTLHHTHAHHAPPRRQPDDASPLAPTKPKPKPRPRTLWAELLRRVYLVDALTCPHCGATRRLLAFVTDQSAIHRILDHVAKTGRGPPDPDDQPREHTRVVTAKQDAIP